MDAKTFQEDIAQLKYNVEETQLAIPELVGIIAVTLLQQLDRDKFYADLKRTLAATQAAEGLSPLTPVMLEDFVESFELAIEAHAKKYPS